MPSLGLSALEEQPQKSFRKSNHSQDTPNSASARSLNMMSMSSITPEEQALKKKFSRDGAGNPIAGVYENCTVMFADIAGFTSWSSHRDPTEVFTLLETMFNVFDAIAKRRGVFKVETSKYHSMTSIVNCWRFGII
jgi:hypothetical protein